MPAIQKILFPVDFSERSAGAARHVQEVAGWFQAEVELLHVVDTGAHWYPQEALPHFQQTLDEYLVDEFKHFKRERVCVLGDPAAKIVEIAKDWHADLIMMPTRGLGAYRRLMLGSVTAKVLHDASCAVWTDVHAETTPPLEEITWRRVLCAIDLGPRSAEVLEWTAYLAGDHRAELGIVHCTAPLMPVPGFVYDPEPALDLNAAAEACIEELQERAGTKASVFITHGSPAKAVGCAAKDFGADLVVIGRHSGVSEGGHLRRHSYAIVRESPCPVISV